MAKLIHGVKRVKIFLIINWNKFYNRFIGKNIFKNETLRFGCFNADWNTDSHKSVPFWCWIDVTAYCRQNLCSHLQFWFAVSLTMLSPEYFKCFKILFALIAFLLMTAKPFIVFCKLKFEVVWWKSNFKILSS